MLEWKQVEGPDPDAHLYEPLFAAMARADRVSRNECPCGCSALLGQCARSPEAEELEVCCGPVSGALLDMNYREEVQRCDDCRIFDTDEQAAEAVAAEFGGVPILVGEPAARYWAVAVAPFARALSREQVEALIVGVRELLAGS